ncbi:hypothetical protein Syun_019577 [Stephania yunnanensis]|uniref:Uncharacterized protein n=1 Tax=Stephania yunnanensis TaxID=152371 RepID=A0AAP0NY42_9MAGN
MNFLRMIVEQTLDQGFHFLMQELSDALMSNPDENGDFVKLESSLSLKGKNAAMVLCWLLGNGCLFAWNGMLTYQDYYVTLFPEHMAGHLWSTQQLLDGVRG